MTRTDIYVGLVQTFGTYGQLAAIMALHRREDGAYVPVEYPIDLGLGRGARTVARALFIDKLKAEYPDKMVRGTTRFFEFQTELFSKRFTQGSRIAAMHDVPLDENPVEGRPIFIGNDLISPQRLALYPAIALARACEKGDVFRANRVETS